MQLTGRGILKGVDVPDQRHPLHVKVHREDASEKSLRSIDWEG